MTPALKAAGWGIVERSTILTEYPIANGQFVAAGGARGGDSVRWREAQHVG